MSYDLEEHLERQIDFSFRTFGPGNRTEHVLDHISKELQEIKEAPLDLEEWIDVVLLSLDGAWRTGSSPKQITAMLNYKLDKNINRDWPDWRTLSENEAITHTTALDV